MPWPPVSPYKFKYKQRVRIHGITWYADDVIEGDMRDNGKVGVVTQRKPNPLTGEPYYGVRLSPTLYDWYSEANLEAVTD